MQYNPRINQSHDSFNADQLYSFLNNNSIPIQSTPYSQTSMKYSPSSNQTQNQHNTYTPIRLVQISPQINSHEFSQHSHEFNIDMSLNYSNIQQPHAKFINEFPIPQPINLTLSKSCQTQPILLPLKINDMTTQYFEKITKDQCTQTYDNVPSISLNDVNLFQGLGNQDSVVNVLISADNSQRPPLDSILNALNSPSNIIRPRYVTSITPSITSCTLMQLIQQNDAYLYIELQNMVQYKGMGQFLALISETLDVGDGTPKEAATVLLRNFMDVIDRILKVVEVRRSDAALKFMAERQDHTKGKYSFGPVLGDSVYFQAPWEVTTIQIKIKKQPQQEKAPTINEHQTVGKNWDSWESRRVSKNDHHLQIRQEISIGSVFDKSISKQDELNDFLQQKKLVIQREKKDDYFQNDSGQFGNDSNQFRKYSSNMYSSSANSQVTI